MINHYITPSGFTRDLGCLTLGYNHFTPSGLWMMCGCDDGRKIFQPIIEAKKGRKGIARKDRKGIRTNPEGVK